MFVQDIWFKTQRVLRTIVQVGIPAFLTFNLLLPQVIEAVGGALPDGAFLWLNAVAAGVTVVAGALSRLMAIPAVNLWLTHLGLGSVPKRAAVVEVEVAPVEQDERDFQATP